MDLLLEADPITKPMFGCTAVYVDEKIVLILRRKEKEIQDNGVWLATTSAHHEELKKIFPSMRSIQLFGPGPTGWQILPEDATDFEESVTQACEMILKKSPLIGKIPGARKSKKITLPKKQKAKTTAQKINFKTRAKIRRSAR